MLELAEGHHPGFLIRPHPGATQTAHMGAHTQGLADIFGQGAHIGAFGTVHPQLEFRIGEIEQLEFMNGDGARLALHLDPFAGQPVEAFALVLDRRIHGGQLLDLAGEAGQHFGHRLGGDPGGIMGFDHVALGVGGGGDLAELHSHQVFLVGVEQKGRDAGGVAQTDGQQPGGQGIEAAGVPGLARLVEVLDLLEGGVGGESHGLVEEQDAADVAPAGPFAPSHDLCRPLCAGRRPPPGR